MAFRGFTHETFAFLRDLEAHNDRAWFAENRERYECEVLGPQREFVDAIGSAFASIDQRVAAVAAVDGSIYRIHRDTRFSADKSPYKTYADMIFWLGAQRKGSTAGYWVRLEPAAVWVGGGNGMLTDEQLARYRTAVDDGVHGRWLAEILGDLTSAGFELGEPRLKRVPAGFSAQHPRAELLRFTELHALEKASPPPDEVFSPKFVDWCMQRFGQVKPLVDWLAEQLGGIMPPDEIA